MLVVSLQSWRRCRHTGPRHRVALCRAALFAIFRSQLGRGNDQLLFGGANQATPHAVARGIPDVGNCNLSLHLFSHFWAIQEALIKVLGIGFAVDMRRSEILRPCAKA